MNKLSILLYLADIFTSLKIFFVFMSVGTLFYMFITSVVKERFPPRLSFVLVFVFGLTATLFPSATTMYLIAGSEAGQTALNSDIGKKVTAALDKVIDVYTKKLEDQRN